MTDRAAPDGFWYVCGACGKTSRTRYGLTNERSPGWDESCMSNSVLARLATAEELQRYECKWIAVDETTLQPFGDMTNASADKL